MNFTHNSTGAPNIVDHEFEIEADGTKIAEISKRWFRVRDTYGRRSGNARRPTPPICRT